VNVERPIGERLGKWEELERETGREEASGIPGCQKKQDIRKGIRWMRQKEDVV
jgi:hypothetical protein